MEEARISATARGCKAELERFRELVGREAKAVIARPLGWLDDISRDDTRSSTTYHREVMSGARLPQENSWDNGRTAVESTIMPNYHHLISFASLSLDGRGLEAFGPFSVTLRDVMVSERSSVFEENPFHFCRRHRVISGEAPPAGYRATWATRGDLAAAKLHYKIESGMADHDFIKLLTTDGPTTGDPDYIEVHIFGNIHRRAIERIRAPGNLRGSDKIIWHKIRSRLVGIGVIIEEKH